MFLKLSIPDKKIWPNSRTHPIKKSTITRHHRQAAFFATLKLLGVANCPTRLLLKDRPIFGILHKGPLRSPDYHKIATLLSPSAPPSVKSYKLTFYFPTTRQRDDDNAAASFKAYRDGIADALRIDDHTLTADAAPTMLIDPANPRLEIRFLP